MLQLIDKLDLQMYTQAETGLHLAHFDDGRKVQFEAQLHPLSSMAKIDYNTFISKVQYHDSVIALEMVLTEENEKTSFLKMGKIKRQNSMLTTKFQNSV